MSSRQLELPSTLQIEVTSRCNLECKMCPLPSKHTVSSLSPGHMSETTWRQVLEAAKMAGRAILAGYGEPFTNPRYLTMLRDLDDAQIWTGMSTNGIALTPRVAESLASLRHLTHINISIDSPDPGVYREVRGGDVQRAFAGLRHLISAIDNPEKVTVSSVVMKRNLASLVEMPATLWQLGVTRYVLQGLVELNPDGKEEYPPDLKEAEERITQIQEACDNIGIKLLVEGQVLPVTNSWRKGGTPSPEHSRECAVPWEVPFIDKDGYVFACCYSSARGGECLGNLNERSLVEIWEDEPFWRVRRQLLDGALPAPCRDCNTIPVGEHILRRYAAKLKLDKSTLNGYRKVRLVAENCGTAVWDANTQLQIGTTRPRDGASAYYHPTWTAPNRVTSFTETSVPPGKEATFIFEIQPSMTVKSEAFQLVVEFVSWLPNTTFEIHPQRAWIDRLTETCIGFRSLYLRLRGYSLREAIKRTATRLRIPLPPARHW